jgi:DNA polymerase I-like protein with 3'-5' exonuclease and polymerase domains
VEILNIYDTMLAELVLNAGLLAPANLLDIAMKYTEVRLKKDVRETFANHSAALTEEQLKYGAVDTLILFPIFEKQWKLLQKENLIKIAKLEFATTGVVGDMEINGVYIDQDRWREIIKNLTKKRNVIAKEFQEMIRPHYKINQMDMFGGIADSINMNSQVQLMDLFNNKLRLNIPSTGVAVMSMVNHPVAKKLLEYRGYEKLISAFGESLLEKVNKKTNRLHPNFQQLRTATGRFACNNPNLQQIPRNSKEAPFRECFNPEPGYKLVTSDYASMEMRILADLSGDKNFIEALLGGLDVHSFTASLMFGKEYTKDFKKQYPELRQAAKAIGFGLMYGMGPSGLAAQIDVSKTVASSYMDKYFSSYPSIKKFLDKMARDAVRRGWSVTPGGRKRWYTLPSKTDPDYNKKIGSIQRRAKNHPIQGTNADAIKYALVFLKERIAKENMDVRITHTVHDEIICEVRNDQAEEWAQMLSAEMVRAGELFISKVPVISESFIGDVWEH